MRKILLSFCLLLAAIGVQAQSVVYVDIEATGANNGTSWADAYDDLTVALDSAAAGSELWVAAGTYVTPDSSSFFIEKELSLYGGFAGTETAASEADPMTNATILSGDVLGNDPATGYDSLLMDDNNRVLVVFDTADTNSFTAVVSGFTITSGVIADDDDGTLGSIIPFSGGGLLALGRVEVSDVIFTNNRANYGSATAFVTVGSSGSSLTNASVEGNFFSRSGIIYSNGGDDLRFADIDYTGTDDTVPTPIIDVLFGLDAVIEDCSFSNLFRGPGAFGGAIRARFMEGLRISRCEFDDVYSSNGGGAIGVISFDLENGARANNPLEAVIDDCVFTGARSGFVGGAVFLQDVNVTISNSEFTQCSSPNGGAIFGITTGDNMVAYTQVISGNTFLANSSLDGGGAILALTDGTTFDISDNTFTSNSSTRDFGGGAIYLQGADGVAHSATLTGNEFSQNSAIGQLAAAVRLTGIDGELRDNTFDDNTAGTGTAFVSGAGRDFEFVNNSFSNNTGTTAEPMVRGGGIASFLDGGDNPTSILVDSCSFTQNIVGQDDFVSGGGAIYVSGESPANATVRISNSLFAGNSTNAGPEGSSGGAIFALNGVDMTIEDCDFINNSSQASGGAITTRSLVSVDSVGGVRDTFLADQDQPMLNISRSLFISNTAAVQGGAIETLSSSVNAENSLFIQNALANDGGSGGAIIINGTTFDTLILENTFVNNTFYGNSDGDREETTTDPASEGNAIALFQDGGTSATANSVILTIQNNAFFQNDPEEESIGIEATGNDGNMEIRSLGGNFFSSELSTAYTIDQVSGTDEVDTDIVDTDVFRDPFLDDITAEFPNLELIGDATSNPLIDAGTTGELVPAIDFYGTERDNMPDIGALEFGSVDPTGVAEPIEKSGLAFEFFPNPASEVLNIVQSEANVKGFTVLLADAQGRLISGRHFVGERNSLPVAQLPAGVYNLTLIVNGKVYSKPFLKR